jgi:hypothetical protein
MSADAAEFDTELERVKAIFGNTVKDTRRMAAGYSRFNTLLV